MSLPPYLQPLGDDVYAIDTGFHRESFDAAYLVAGAGRASFIDTGTRHAVPRLLGALDALGLGISDVEHVIVTHVHLDHAGGAGTLMAALPSAQLVVHPRGARHMIDPSALYQGALAVYGQAEMDRSYGQLDGITPDRVLSTHDGMQLDVGGRTLEFIDTPGHARHHHCIWDEQTRGWFTGDTLGLSYREFDVDGRPWLMPTTTPVQFEPAALRQSVDRLMAREPARAYLTHYAAIPLSNDIVATQRQLLDDTEALGLNLRDATDRGPALRRGLRAMYIRSLRAHGCGFADDEIDALLALDIELNAQGMEVWLDRTPRAAG